MDLLRYLSQRPLSTIRLSIPLIFTALAGLFSERSGIFDIGLEGKMLGPPSPRPRCIHHRFRLAWPCCRHPLLGRVELGAWLCFDHQSRQPDHLRRGHQLLHRRLTIVLGQAWFGQGGRTPQLSGSRFAADHASGCGCDAACPDPRSALCERDLGQQYPDYLAFLLVPLSWWILYRTRFGLRLRAVGENPGASIRPASRSAGCAIEPSCAPASSAVFRAPICRSRNRRPLSRICRRAKAISRLPRWFSPNGSRCRYVRLPAFRLPRCFGNLMQGKEVPLIGQVPVQSSRPCPIF